MDTIEFPVDSIKEINRSMYSLYKFFSEVCSKIQSPDYRHHTPTQELDFQTRPWLFYVFQYGDKKLSIKRFRNGFFSLVADGFVITKLQPYKGRSHCSDYRYDNYYGRFDSFQECLKSFNFIAKNIVDNSLGVLF